MWVPRLALLLAAAPCAGAADAPPPNVLLIVSDDLQACLGAYGNSVCRTPHLDRLAREGVRFSRAYCQFPLCAPSRASFMTGLYPEATGVADNAGTLGAFRAEGSTLRDHPSLGGFLRGNGYFSARVSKIFHMGVPGGIERGDVGDDDPGAWDYAFNVMGPETLSPGERRLLSPQHTHYGSSFATVCVPDERVEAQTDFLATSQAIAILESRAGVVIDGATNLVKRKPAQPFFLAVGLVRPHVPFVAPKRLFEQYPQEDMQLSAHPADDLLDVPGPAALGHNDAHYRMGPAAQREAIAAYYASVSFMDEQVGRLLDALERLGLRDDTVVVFLSDHGWNLGEHGCWQKLSLWEDVTRVPLIVSAPGFEATAGRVCSSLVELVDLYPTVADLCGMTENAPERLQGESLRRFLEDPFLIDPEASAYTRTVRGARSLRVGNLRYSDWGDAGEELYDHGTDPGEFTNLAEDPAHAQVLEGLRARLQARPKDAGGGGA